ncbi:hypothetical protein KVT40_001703 [Elsinoe batatas]|uniref:Zn(2)-C6 fungal-type domain-containing protein n=1 Tax=Elsinoe batatas TaxID=2601811 RepID=A0A8K0L7U1_9PEZI|nr:hypothetical protein KVT40_001703 [Elsinoe batatas]
MEKRAKTRVRATRACDRCKSKKLRCSGDHPCTACTKLRLNCAYNALYRRGKLPNIVERDQASPGQSLSTPGHDASTKDTIDSVPMTRSSQIQNDEHSTSPPAGSSRDSPDHDHVSPHGNYHGSASGLAFLSRAQKRLHSSMPLSENISIFAFGDAPLPETDESFLRLPPIAEARQLVKTYFDVAFPTHRFLHEPTVEAWMQELYQHKPTTSLKPGARERSAIVMLVLAHAMLFRRKGSLPSDAALDSANLFAASEHQLGRETGEVRLSAVQARLAQCFYLLAQSRVNQCWNLFGTTARLAFALGIHRKHKLAAGRKHHSQVDHESRKRTFWAAYSLDNYLSAALGRPRALHEQDIDQEYPDTIDDHDLSDDKGHVMAGPNSEAQSVMLAPVYHAKLSRIISSVLTQQYGIIRPSWDVHASLARSHLEQIATWRSEILPFLDAQWTSIGLMIPPFSRQCTVLNLASCYTTLLTARPLLLCSRQALQSCTLMVQSQIRECRLAGLDAAMRIIKIVRGLCDGNKMFDVLWFTFYYTFNALTVLYVYIIEHRNESQEDWQAHLADAEACLSSLSQTVPLSSFTARYGVVLEELRHEASRRLSTQPLARHTPANAPEVSINDTGPAPSAADLDMFSLGNMQDFDQTSPSSFLAGVSGWADIETLVGSLSCRRKHEANPHSSTPHYPWLLTGSPTGRCDPRL